MMEAGQFYEESEQRLRIHKLRERIAVAMARCRPWTATPEDLAELERLAEELEAVLQKELPPGVEPSWLHRDLGEIEQRRAWICSWRGELAPAGLLYEKAFRSFDAAGLPEQAQDCRDKLAELANWGSRDLDEMRRKAEDARVATQEGVLVHCEALLALAQVHLAAHDLHEAKEWLQKTEQLLRWLAPQPPAREEILATVHVLPDGTEPPGTPSPFLRLSRIHDLYLGVYCGLADICTRMNPSEEAERYSQILRELRANELKADELNEMWPQVRANMPRFDPATLEVLQPDQALLDELRRVAGDDFVGEMLSHQKTWEDAFKADPFRDVKIPDIDPVHIREDLERLDREDEKRPVGAPREDLLDRARALQEKARASGNPPLIAWAQLSEAYLLSRSGRDEYASSLLDQAEETLGESGDDLKAFLYGLRAEIQARKGDWSAVSATCEHGIDLVEKLRFRVSTLYMQSAYLKPRLHVYTLGARASHQLGRVDEMLDRADRSKSRAILGHSLLSRIEAPLDEATEEKLAEVCREIDARVSSGEVPAELLQHRRLLADRLLLEQVRLHRPGPLPDLDLAAIRASLAPDEALLYYYWLGDRELLLAVLDRDGIWHEIRDVAPNQRETLQAFGLPGRPSKSG